MAGQNQMFGTAVSSFGPMDAPGVSEYNTGTQAAPSMIAGAATFGAPIAMGIGGMMGGPIGGMLDPTTGALRGFGRGVGWRSGAGFGANIGNVFRGGVGGIARGVGMGALGFLPGAAIYGAANYAAGQMVEGAQFQNQMGSFLQRNFRFTNPASETGYGFGTSQRQQIGRMVQEMGIKDVMSTPQELMNIMKGGTQMGLFRGIQDARQFKNRFKEVKDTLQEIAQTFNSTLSDALPFLGQARQMGFWTPQDITKHAGQVRQVQSATGMNAQQVQQTMAVGAQMVRSIGGTGQQGAQMMARAHMMAGSAAFGNVVSERELGEAGFGIGEQGTMNLGNMLGGLSARFARGRTGRWALAAMMNREGTGLDPAALAAFTSGGLSIGRIGSLARRNVGGGRAYKFVQNEEELRGQLAQAGPQAALGIVQSLAGQRLWGEGDRDKLVTNRVIRRFFGGTKRQAEIIAKMAREMPRIMAIQSARSESSLDAQERQREQMMNNTYEGFKRKIGQWWSQNVDGPLQQAGAEISNTVGRSYQNFVDKLTGQRGRGLGVSPAAVRSMVRAAQTGNLEYIQETMAGPGAMQEFLGGAGGGVGMEAAERMRNLGFSPTQTEQLFGARGMGIANAIAPGIGGLAVMGMNKIASAFGYGQEFGAGQIDEMRGLTQGSRGIVGAGSAKALGFGTTEAMTEALGGTGARNIQTFLRSSEVQRMRMRMGMGTLSESDRMKYARGVLQRVQAGAAGEAAQRLVSGLSERQALARLMAAQGKVGGEFTALGDMGAGIGEGNIRERIAEAQEQADQGLAEVLGGGSAMGGLLGRAGAAIAGLATAPFGGAGLLKRAFEGGEKPTEAGIEELRKDPRGAEAFRLFHSAEEAEKDGDMDKARALREKARGRMSELAQDTESGISKSARSAAILLGDASDPRSKAAAKASANIGLGIKTSNSHMFAKQLARRRRRVVEQLGGEGGQGRFNLMQLAGKDSEIGKALSSALRVGTEKDPITAKEHVTQMTNLARLAIEDPDKAARMAALLQQEGLAGTELEYILSGAGRVSTMAELGISAEAEEGLATGGRRGLGKARKGLKAMLTGMGLGGIDQKTITGLIRGDETAKETFTEIMRSKRFGDPDIKKFIEEARGGLTEAEMRSRGAGLLVGGGVTTHSEQVAKEAGLKKGELHLTGREGSSKGMHETLKVHTVYFRQMVDALGKISRNEKITKKGPEGEE